MWKKLLGLLFVGCYIKMADGVPETLKMEEFWTKAIDATDMEAHSAEIKFKILRD